MLQNLSLRLRIFLIFAGLAFGALAGLTGGLVFGYRQLGTPETLNAFVQVGMLAGAVVLGLVTWVWYLFDVNVAKPIDVLSGALRARAHADVSGALDSRIAQYLGDLAPAATAAAASLAETRNALAEAVARETTRLA
ncbi:MAG TPA: DNA polymerase III subunit epsilon, partial [Gemmobacter sp.]|nr:DNA polymerase III subunit epsilon [Gemmobacter sp.]